jgi:hypothetical protein
MMLLSVRLPARVIPKPRIGIGPPPGQACRSGYHRKSGKQPDGSVGMGWITMDFMSTATVVAIVVVLMLLGLGIVINQLLRLRKYLNDSPPGPLPGADRVEPPDGDLPD